MKQRLSPLYLKALAAFLIVLTFILYTLDTYTILVSIFAMSMKRELILRWILIS